MPDDKVQTFSEGHKFLKKNLPISLTFQSSISNTYDKIFFSNILAFSEYLNFNTVKRSGLVRPNSVYIIPSTVLTSGCSSTYLFFLMTGHYTLIKWPHFLWWRIHGRFMGSSNTKKVLQYFDFVFNIHLILQGKERWRKGVCNAWCSLSKPKI